MNRLTNFAKILFFIFFVGFFILGYWIISSIYYVHDYNILIDQKTEKGIQTKTGFIFLNSFKYDIKKKDLRDINLIQKEDIKIQLSDGKIYSTHFIIQITIKDKSKVNYVNNYILKHPAFINYINEYFSIITYEDLFKNRHIHYIKIKDWLLQNSQKDNYNIQNFYWTGLIQ